MGQLQFQLINYIRPDCTFVSTDSPHAPQIVHFREELSQWRFYQLEPRTMRKNTPVKQVDTPGPSGANLTAFFNTLKIEKPKQFKLLSKTLKALFGIQNVVVQPDLQGMLLLQIIEEGVPYSIRIVSEGTLRVLALLAIVTPLSLAKTRVLGYEEPENGVHPRRLKLIADLLKNAAESGTQVLINTHSPVLPDYFEPESVVICRKQGHETVFIPFTRYLANGHATDMALADEPMTSFAERVIRGDFDE